MEEQRKEDEAMESQFDNEDDDDDFDPFLHATVPRNLYHKFQTEGSKRWGPPTEILPFLFLGSCFCANEEVLLRDLGVDHILNVAEECPPPPTVASRKDKGEKLVKHYMMVDVVEHIRKSENQWNTFESCFNFIDKARVAYEAKYGGGKKRKGSKRMKRPGGAEERGERKSSGMKIKKLSLRAGKDRDKERETATSAATGDATLTGPASDRVLVHCMHGRSRSATIVLAYLMKKEGWTLRQAYVHVKLRRPIVGPDKYLKHQLIEYEQHLFGKSSFQSVEEFRDYQLLLTPELVLKEKERKQKLKEEEARQQEQSCSSNDDNTTKLDDVEQQADADEEEPSGKEITADGEAPEGEALEGDDAEEEVSSSPRTPSTGAATGDDEEGKGSGKKKKKKKKKSKKASEDEETDGANGEEKTAAKKAKKSKKKDKAAGGTPLTKRKKKRQEGGTSSSGGSAAGSPRGDDVAGVNNEEPRKRANSASAAPAQGTGGRASRSNTATKMA